jgi:hypothetical protein
MCELQAAWHAGAHPVSLGVPGRIALVTTCFKREASLHVALAVNLACRVRFRGALVFSVTTFGRDRAILDTLARRYPKLLTSVFLQLASGGEAGQGWRECDWSGGFAPEWMPEAPGGFVDHERGMGPPALKFWHAARAKNAAHEHALFRDPDLALLASVDADNLVPSAYVRGLAHLHFECPPHVECFSVRPRNVEGALTGRLASGS